MQYAFILGRVYTLSLAELLDVLKNLKISYKILACSPEVVVLETDKAIDAQVLQPRLGGIIKIIRLFDTFKKKGKEYPSQVLESYFTFKRIKSEYFTEYTGKKQFGVSIYSLDPTIRFREESARIAFLIKKILQEEAQSVRAVIPQFPSQSLSSVLVNENQLMQKGAEIVIISGTQRMFIGKTMSVQNYEDYGRRDYQRPARDEKSGMIPPKVAQSMINLGGPLKSLDYILDPFCGSGTILQEATLLGFKAAGSDIDEKAVANSEKNLEWFRNRYHVALNRYKLFVADASEISLQLPGLKIEAIVTEGTLGPIYFKLPTKVEMSGNFKMLSKLYDQVFKEFNKILPPGHRVVMCLPAYKMGYNYEYMHDIDFAVENGYTVLDPLPAGLAEKYKFLRVTPRKSVVYDRKDQIVAREIIILENVQVPIPNSQTDSDSKLEIES
ncbi:MAG TPA: DNA methyltransferase [Patescibacteria group bacterium]|jgi:tRNA G10  N-methylase Trm11|nr:DNA methyltransferase [Patescibacteria group bacterium]